MEMYRYQCNTRATMTTFDALLLGLVQGIAEFLPISSSGHLIVARELLGVRTEHGLAVDAVLQLATVLAVAVYFRRDLWALVCVCGEVVRGRAMASEHRTLFMALVLGTVPAAVAGVFLEDLMDTTFRSARLVAWVLLLGSLLFAAAEWVSARYRVAERVPGSDTRGWPAPLFLWRGIAVGCFQALALVPGMSRSGASIAGGLFVGLSREQAARFAFLLSVPIIFGSGMKKLLELGGAGLGSAEWHTILLASGVAFAIGLAAIHFLLVFVRRHTLFPFVWYRVAFALLVLAFV